MKYQIKAGTTSYIAYISVDDSSSTVGAKLTGLVFNSGSLTAYYCRTGAAATSITLATQTATGAYSSGGFVAVDGTNMPGVYRFDIPDAAIAASANKCVIVLKGATNMVPVHLEIELVAYDPQDAVRLGLTALANASAGASGGLLISGSNSGTTTLGALTVTGATTLTGNVSAAAGVTITQSTTNGHGIVTTGNGTGSGLRVVAGATGNGLTAIGGSTSGHGIQATVTSGNEIDADLTGAIVGNITGNLSGSVGSVTATVGANVLQFGSTNGTFSGGIPEVNTVQWRGTQPNTLVSNRVDVSAGAIASGAITSTAIATDAITSTGLAASAANKVRDATTAAVVESQGSYTVAQVLSLSLSLLAGRSASGVFKTPDNVSTRASFTYTGNDRTAVTLTP